MNTINIQENDREFLLRSIRFCSAVDPYLVELGLDKIEVELFKNEMAALLYLSENYKSLSTNIVLYNIGAMRRGLSVLMHDCLQSINYTKNIGKMLGIKEPVKISSATFDKLVFYMSFQN